MMNFQKSRFVLKNLILIVSLFSLQNCGRKSHSANERKALVTETADGISDEKNQAQTEAETKTTKAGQAAGIRDALVDYGFRDFSQIYYTMATVTGIDPNNSDLRKVYEGLLLSLPPPGNDIKSFAAAHQSAIFKMGVEFCHNLMDSPDLRVKILPKFNFEANLETAFAGQAKKDLALTLLNQFWGSGLENRPSYEEASTTLASLIDEIVADSKSLESIPQGLRTTNVVKGVCVAVLTSLPANVL